MPSQLIITLVEADDRIMYFERIGSSGFKSLSSGWLAD